MRAIPIILGGFCIIWIHIMRTIIITCNSLRFIWKLMASLGWVTFGGFSWHAPVRETNYFVHIYTHYYGRPRPTSQNQQQDEIQTDPQVSSLCKYTPFKLSATPSQCLDKQYLDHTPSRQQYHNPALLHNWHQLNKTRWLMTQWQNATISTYIGSAFYTAFCLYYDYK